MTQVLLQSPRISAFSFWILLLIMFPVVNIVGTCPISVFLSFQPHLHLFLRVVSAGCSIVPWRGTHQVAFEVHHHGDMWNGANLQ